MDVVVGVSVLLLSGTAYAIVCGECQGTGCDCICEQVQLGIGRENGVWMSCVYYQTKICVDQMYVDGGLDWSCTQDPTRVNTTFYGKNCTGLCGGCNQNGLFEASGTSGGVLISTTAPIYVCKQQGGI